MHHLKKNNKSLRRYIEFNAPLRTSFLFTCFPLFCPGPCNSMEELSQAEPVLLGESTGGMWRMECFPRGDTKQTQHQNWLNSLDTLAGKLKRWKDTGVKGMFDHLVAHSVTTTKSLKYIEEHTRISLVCSERLFLRCRISARSLEE